MACEDQDKFNVDPMNDNDVKYDDQPEEESQAFEIQLEEMRAKAKRKLIACYERTPQGMIKREESIMPTLYFIYLYEQCK